MINLSKHFKNDVVVAGQSLMPVIIIADTHQIEYYTGLEQGFGEYITDIKFAFTLNQTLLYERQASGDYAGYIGTLTRGGPLLQTIPSLKNVSNVKVSSDYNRKTLKINTLRFELYNYYDPNKKLSEYIDDNLLNAEIFLFYKSPTTNSINCYPHLEDQAADEDCPIMFRGEISRIKTTSDTISITAEDKTQKEISDKKVPYMTIDRLPQDVLEGIPDQYKTSENSVPMVFGKVDKSRVIPYINKYDPRDLNLLIDFCPTYNNFPTSKIPSFFSDINPLPSGNPYFLYVKSGNDYLILDHFLSTNNMQPYKLSRVSLYLTGGAVSPDYLLPIIFGEEASEEFGLYDMIGYQQRVVERSFVTMGSILGLDTIQLENLSNSHMENIDKISDNNGFEKRWYRFGEEVFSADNNFNVTNTYNSSETQKGDGMVIVLSLEKGVSNELININDNGLNLGNTFMLSDFKLESQWLHLNEDNDNVDNFGGEGDVGGGMFVTPLSPTTWNSIASIHASLPWSDITSNEAIYAYQAIANLLIAETDEQIENILDDPMANLELFCPESDFYKNSALYMTDNENWLEDSRYWGDSGNNNVLNGNTDYKRISINGLYFGSKTSENIPLLVGESPDAHNNIMMYEYFPPSWRDEENGAASLSYGQNLEMNNVAFLHSVKIDDIRKQDIFASVEGRLHHMFTEQIEPSLYQIGTVNPDLFDNSLSIFTKNSDGSAPNLTALVDYFSDIMRSIFNPPYHWVGLKTTPVFDPHETNPPMLGNLIGSEGNLNNWEADWSSPELGGYDITGHSYSSTGGEEGWGNMGDGLAFDTVDLWLQNYSGFDSIVEYKWNEYQQSSTLTVGDAIFANHYSLFRTFIYAMCMLPVRVAMNWNVLYDTQGHNINIAEIFGRKFFIKLILEYIFQEDIDYNFEDSGYDSWNFSYWHRWKMAPEGSATLLQLTDSFEERLSAPYPEYRQYSWNSFGELENLSDWIDNFYLYMDDLSSAYNKCLRDMEIQIQPEGGIYFWHYDNDYSSFTSYMQWGGRTNFANWISQNAWYYGISYYDNGKLSNFRTNLLQLVGLSEDEDEEPATTDTSGIVEKPSDIVMNILTTEMEYGKFIPLDNSGEIQAQSTSEIGMDILKPDYRYFDIPKIEESRFAHSNWQMGFCIDKKTNGKRLIEQILKESKSYPTFTSDGKFSLITIGDVYNDENIDKVINLNDILSYNFSQTKREDIATRVKAYYRYDNGQNKYLSYLEKDINDLLPNYRETATLAYSLEKTDSYKEINLRYHSQRDTVENFVDYTLMKDCNPHIVCDLKLTLNNIDVSIGDVIHIPLIKEENAFDIDYSKINYLHTQIIYPFWIIMKKDVSLNSIKIKAVQLHHLSSTDLRMENYSGEYGGGDGYIEPIVGNTFQYNSIHRFHDPEGGYGGSIPNWNYNPNATVHEGPEIPFFDTQRSNSPGIINVTDIVKTVNIILGTEAATNDDIELLTTYNYYGMPGPSEIDVIVVVSIVNIVLGAWGTTREEEGETYNE